MEDTILNLTEIVNGYIDNEINYIKREMECCGDDLYQDLCRLENMSDEEKSNIIGRVADDNELNEKINETIHYYLYH